MHHQVYRHASSPAHHHQHHQSPHHHQSPLHQQQHHQHQHQQPDIAELSYEDLLSMRQAQNPHASPVNQRAATLNNFRRGNLQQQQQQQGSPLAQQQQQQQQLLAQMQMGMGMGMQGLQGLGGMGAVGARDLNMQILAMQQQQNQLELELQMQQIRMQSLQLQEQIIQQQREAQAATDQHNFAQRRVASLAHSSPAHHARSHIPHSASFTSQSFMSPQQASPTSSISTLVLDNVDDEHVRQAQRRGAFQNVLRTRAASAGPGKLTFGNLARASGMPSPPSERSGTPTSQRSNSIFVPSTMAAAAAVGRKNTDSPTASSGLPSPPLASPPSVILSKPGDSFPFMSPTHSPKTGMTEHGHSDEEGENSDAGSDKQSSETAATAGSIHAAAAAAGALAVEGEEDKIKKARRVSAGAAVLELGHKGRMAEVLSTPPPAPGSVKKGLSTSGSMSSLSAAAKPFSFPTKPLLPSTGTGSPTSTANLALHSRPGSGAGSIAATANSSGTVTPATATVNGYSGLGHGFPGQSSFPPSVHAILANGTALRAATRSASAAAGIAPGPGGNGRSRVEPITTIRQPKGPVPEGELAKMNFSARIRKRAIGTLMSGVGGMGGGEESGGLSGSGSVGGLSALAAAAERRASRRLSGMGVAAA